MSGEVYGGASRRGGRKSGEGRRVWARYGGDLDDDIGIAPRSPPPGTAVRSTTEGASLEPPHTIGRSNSRATDRELAHRRLRASMAARTSTACRLGPAREASSSVLTMTPGRSAVHRPVATRRRTCQRVKPARRASSVVKTGGSCLVVMASRVPCRQWVQAAVHNSACSADRPTPAPELAHLPHFRLCLPTGGRNCRRTVVVRPACRAMCRWASKQRPAGCGPRRLPPVGWA